MSGSAAPSAAEGPAGVLDFIGDVVIDYAPDGTIQWASPSLLTVLGYDPADVIGTRLRLSVDEDLAAANGVMADAVASGAASVRSRVRSRCADGSVRWTETHAQFVRDEAGVLQRIVATIRDVTEHVEAEQRFALAMEHSAIGMALVAPDGGFLEVNPALCGMLGRDEVSLLAATWQELTHPDDVTVDLGLVNDVLAGARDSYRLRKRYVQPDGSIVWGDLSVSAVRNEDRTVNYFIAQIVDVTEQVATEDRYRLLAENATDTVALGNNDGTLEWVSPSVEGLLGRTAADLAGRPFRDLVHPDDLPAVAATQAGLLRGEVGGFEIRLLTRDGGFRWMGITVKPVVDDRGNVVARVAAWRDVQAAFEARAALQQSEEQFRLLAENASDIVIEVRGDGTVDWASPSALDVLARRPEDIVGTQPWDIVHPDDQEPSIAALAQVASGEVTSSKIDVRVSRADGTYVWMAATGHHAAADRVVVSFRDIDARVAAQRAAEEAKQLAEEEGARLRAHLDSQIEPHVTMRAVRDSSGSIVDFTYDDANPAALAYLQMSMEQFVGQSLMGMYPSTAAKVMRDMYAHTVETGEPLIENDYTYPNEMYAGEVRVYDLRGAKLGDGIALSWEDVTDRSLMAQQIAESEHRYRLLSDNATDVVYMVGPDRRVSWISPTVTSTLGWDPEDLVGTSMYDLIHLDDRPRIDALREAVFRGEEIVNPAGGWPSRFRHKDGTYTWMALKTTTVNEDNGQLAYAVTGMRDVDALMKERNQAEYEAHRRMAIVDTLLDPHVLLQAVRDESGTIVDFIYLDANDAACEYNRTPRDKLIGMHLLELLPGQAGSGMLAMYADAVESGEPLVLNDFAYPHEILGEDRRFDIRAVRVGDALSFTWRDITERFEIAERIAQSEEQYRLLAENSSDVVLRARDGIMQWLSPALFTTLGWSPSEWIGRRFEEFTHPDDVALAQRRRVEINAGAERVTTLRMRDARGAYHWVEVHAGPAVGQTGEPDGIVASFRVVDAEVAAKQELERRATYDDLTGALKRDPALNVLGAIARVARQPGLETGVLFIDVDEFKTVNDTWGHLAGDALLRTLADRIRSVIRADDTVARMGGDEFMVTLTGIHDLSEAAVVAEKIRALCSHDVPTPDGVVTATLSIGVTLADPIESGDDLIARADRAMYAAKRGGRNRVVAVPLRSRRGDPGSP